MSRQSKMSQELLLEATGERFVPTKMQAEVEIEHWHRYAFAVLLTREKRVLDIASGEGYGSALLAELATSVIGVDINKEAIYHASASYSRSNLKFLLGSCTDIPLTDASVD